MKILSIWKNPKYPGKTAKIIEKDGDIAIYMGYKLGLELEMFVDYEKILWSDGWRKIPQ